MFSGAPRVLRKGRAVRVVFFYPGEEGTYVDQPFVTLYENGIVHLANAQEETTTHLQNCEILWRFDIETEKTPSGTFKLLRMPAQKNPRETPPLDP